MYTLQINFKTYNPKNFFHIINFLKTKKQNFRIFQSLNISELIPLVQKKVGFTVLKSPHVHKKSREHFQHVTKQRVLYITSSKVTVLLYFNYIVSIFVNQGLSITSKINYKPDS